MRSTPVEGRGKSRSGQRESLSWSGGLVMTANPIGNLGVKWLFRIILSWARWPGFYLPSLDTNSLWTEMWPWAKLLHEDEARDSVQGVDSWRLSAIEPSWKRMECFLLSLCVCVCVRVNQIVVQMHSLLWVLVKAVCKPLASLGCASAWVVFLLIAFWDIASLFLRLCLWKAALSWWDGALAYLNSNAELSCWCLPCVKKWQLPPVSPDEND